MLKHESTCAEIPRTEAIARLNDDLRKTGRGGTIVVTLSGVSTNETD